MTTPPDDNVTALADRRKARPKSGNSSEASWLKHAQRDDRGRPVANLANAMLALRSAPELAWCFAYDEMLCAPILNVALPTVCAEDPGDVEDPRPVRDTDATHLQEWLQLAGLPRIGKDTVHSAVDLRARERSFHPVKEYLDCLTWDGTARLDRWLATYLGADATPYHAGIGRMFLVAMVARIYQPGSKSDHMPVLEGPQGVRKSTACAILGGEWFSDSLPDVTEGKDVAQHLVGKWLVELAELSSMSKAESATLKAFISRPVERYRPSYGRKEIIQPRMCTFVGTTNKSAYLRDETGGRRFWPVKVGTIDTDALIRDRDQLFAEAVVVYTSGGQWWPDQAFERRHIMPQQEARFEIDVWEEPIEKHIIHKSSVLIGDIARDALSLETPHIGRADQNRITAILERLRWQRGAKDWKGNVPWKPIDRPRTTDDHG